MSEVTELDGTEGIRAATSAFSKGKDQTLNNTNVLNASGNITYLDCSAQITQAIVDALLNGLANGLASNNRQSGIPLADVTSFNLIGSISNDVNSTTSGNDDNPLGTSNKSENIPCAIEDTSLVGPQSDVVLEEGRSVSVSESESNSSVSMVASYESLFIPEETLARFPSGQEVYVQKLFPLQYGFPLWFPQPPRNLPLEYRRKGISAGDVGVIMSTGNFHFLFNISLPAGHPINPTDLPDDFVYLSEDKLRSDSHVSFNAGHSTVSNLDIVSDQDENTNDIVITCQDGSKGAILSIPDGAFDEDLVNEWELKEFISKNALIWYRYARHRGIELNHRSLYLVTGHMKSKSWGIATFNKEVPERNAVLKIAKSHIANDLPIHWRKSGGANVSRTGPSPDPDLASENSSPIENQCLFLRGFQISLSKAMWTKMWSTSTAVPVENSSDKYHESPMNRDSDKKSNHEHGLGSDGQSFTDKRCTGNNIGLSIFPDRNTIFHPLTVLNDILLSMVPNAHISVIHERSWLQFISQKKYSRPELHELIQSQFVIGYCEKTGMCTIEPRKNTSSRLIHGRSKDMDVNLTMDATEGFSTEQKIRDETDPPPTRGTVCMICQTENLNGWLLCDVCSIFRVNNEISFNINTTNLVPPSPSFSTNSYSTRDCNSTNSSSSESTCVGDDPNIFSKGIYDPDHPFYIPDQPTSNTSNIAIYEQHPYPSASVSPFPFPVNYYTVQNSPGSSVPLFSHDPSYNVSYASAASTNVPHGHEHSQSTSSGSTSFSAAEFLFPSYQGQHFVGSKQQQSTSLTDSSALTEKRDVSNRPRSVRGAEASMGRNRTAIGSTRVCPYPSPNASPRVGSDVLPPSPPKDPSLIDDLNSTADASQRIRKPELSFTCPLPGCGSTFVTQQGCQRHEQLHTNFRPSMSAEVVAEGDEYGIPRPRNRLAGIQTITPNTSIRRRRVKKDSGAECRNRNAGIA